MEVGPGEMRMVASGRGAFPNPFKEIDCGQESSEKSSEESRQESRQEENRKEGQVRLLLQVASVCRATWFADYDEKGPPKARNSAALSVSLLQIERAHSTFYGDFFRKCGLERGIHDLFSVRKTVGIHGFFRRKAGFSGKVRLVLLFAIR
jgi:hypothetical protein